jgi:hypothetical protein
LTYHLSKSENQLLRRIEPVKHTKKRKGRISALLAEEKLNSEGKEAIEVVEPSKKKKSTKKTNNSL